MADTRGAAISILGEAQVRGGIDRTYSEALLICEPRKTIIFTDHTVFHISLQAIFRTMFCFYNVLSNVRAAGGDSGALIGAPLRTWQDWEYGRRNMPNAKWELWQIRAKGS